MTQKDKELLLADLCARLPYGVILKIDDENEKLRRVEKNSINCYSLDAWKVLPYLRSMSNMTGKEKAEYHHLCESVWDADAERMFHYDTYKSIDYLNSICVDYRGLIKKGLALKAPDGMYNN